MNITFVFDPTRWLPPPQQPKAVHAKEYIGTLEVPKVLDCLTAEELTARIARYWEQWKEDEDEQDEHLNMTAFVAWLKRNHGWHEATNHVVATFDWPPMMTYAEWSKKETEG